jgi:dethiobiotin synthetase
MTMPFRVFVTATDTGVGKTETSCALLSLLAEAGHRPVGFKPYESGCEDLERPADALRHQQASGASEPLAQVSLHRFREPLAPGVAAERREQVPDFQKTLDAFHAFQGRSLVVEGAGGLLVPLDSQRMVIDLIAALRLPVVLVARAGLGTLNHTGLSLEALFRRNLPVKAVVLSKGSESVDVSEEDNPRWIARLYGVPVFGPVPFVQDEALRHEAFRQVLRPLLDTTGFRPG